MSEEILDEALKDEAPEAESANAESANGVALAKILEEDMLEARKELQRGYRDYEVDRDGTPFKVRLIRATKEIEDQAEIVRASAYYNILVNSPGVPTESQIIDALKGRGINIEEGDERIEEIDSRLQRIRNLVYKYQEELDTQKGRFFAAEIEKLENERVEIGTEKKRLELRRAKFMEGSVEQMAGHARQQFVFRHCILDAEKDAPIWIEEDDWLNAAQADSEFHMDCMVKLLMFWNAVPGSIDGTLETFSDGSLEDGQSE